MGWDINEKNATLYVFTAFLALSRFGLWGFDLSVTQIMQEQVPQEVIGTVNGVQSSICEMFHIIMYIATLVITNPADFWLLVTAAISNVGLSAVIFTCWYCGQDLSAYETKIATEEMAMAPVQLVEEGENDEETMLSNVTFPEPETPGGRDAVIHVSQGEMEEEGLIEVSPEPTEERHHARFAAMVRHSEE